MVKRLQTLRSTHISDNPARPSEEVPLSELEVVGKVLLLLQTVPSGGFAAETG